VYCVETNHTASGRRDPYIGW